MEILSAIFFFTLYLILAGIFAVAALWGVIHIICYIDGVINPTITATSTEVGNEAVFEWVENEEAVVRSFMICRDATDDGSCYEVDLPLSQDTIRAACAEDLHCWSVLEKYAK